eukprot:6104522-Alexandrium_andersonii.AAC.1
MSGSAVLPAVSCFWSPPAASSSCAVQLPAVSCILRSFLLFPGGRKSAKGRVWAVGSQRQEE